MTRVLIIEARFYDHIADGLLKGVVAELAKNNVDYRVVTVPGILELPPTLALHVRAQEQGTIEDHYDGYVVLGCAIRGETDHYHHVSQEAFRGVQEVALKHLLAVGNGTLTVHNEKQALDRSMPERKNLGGQAARACLRMIEMKRELAIS